MRHLALLTLLALAACGAAGAPTPPDGLSMSGSVQMGVAHSGS